MLSDANEPSDSSLNPDLSSVTTAIGAKFFSSGTHVVPKEAFTLFYGQDENVRRVDVLTATEHQLQNLVRACDIVSEDDDAYFYTLQPADFSSNFNLELNGLLDAIRPTLLDGFLETRAIEAELRELIIYNEGSQFTSVKDPRENERMFASLVIAFPTRYEGGNVLFRHDLDEFSMNFATMLEGSPTPSIAFAAYFCDVYRTLSPIISGHCLTLEYNLYLPDISGPSRSPSVTTWNEHALRRTLSDLLSSPTFLPNGGYLAYSLRCHYPVTVPPNAEDQFVDSGLPELRGIDAVFLRICRDLSLRVDAYIVYNTSRAETMSDRFHPPIFTEYETKVLIETCYRVLGRNTDPLWVSELRSHGNDLMSYVPGGLCLEVRVGPVGERATSSLKRSPIRHVAMMDAVW